MLEVAGKIPQKPPAWITLSFGGIAARAFFDPQAGLAVRPSDIRNFPGKLLVQPLTNNPTISNPGAPPSASLIPGPRGPIDLRPVRPWSSLTVKKQDFEDSRPSRVRFIDFGRLGIGSDEDFGSFRSLQDRFLTSWDRFLMVWQDFDLGQGQFWPSKVDFDPARGRFWASREEPQAGLAPDRIEFGWFWSIFDPGGRFLTSRIDFWPPGVDFLTPQGRFLTLGGWNLRPVWPCFWAFSGQEDVDFDPRRSIFDLRDRFLIKIEFLRFWLTGGRDFAIFGVFRVFWKIWSGFPPKTKIS